MANVILLLLVVEFVSGLTIDCGSFDLGLVVRCSERDLEQLELDSNDARRLHALSPLIDARNQLAQLLKPNDSSWPPSFHSLCEEPVLLAPNDNWSVACVWSWDRKIRCSAAPPGLFGYVVLSEWKDQLSEFRQWLGCPPSTYQTVPQQMDEVYFCRERCEVLGLGVVAFMVIFSSLALFVLYYVLCRTHAERNE